MAAADVVEQDLVALTFKGRSDVSPHMLATPKAVRIDEHGDVRANCIDHMHVVALTNFHCCSFRAVSPQILHA